MPNGTTCCALEICCNAAEKRVKVVASLAAFTHADPEYCERFLDWMTHEGLVFAPEEFQTTIDTIAMFAMKHAADK